MRIRNILVIIAVWLAVTAGSLFYFGSNHNSTDVITIVADPWCPYTCSLNDERPGFMIEIAIAAFKLYDIDVQYKVMPWSDAVSMTREGKLDAIVGALPGDAPDFIYPAKAQGMSDNRLWTRTDSTWEYKGPASLENIKVGVIEGYSYGPAFDEYIKTHATNEKRVYITGGNTGLEQNIFKLKAGTLDAIAEDKRVVLHYLRKNQINMPLKSAGNINDDGNARLYIAFSPKKTKSKRYAELLVEGIDTLRRSGELKKILDLYEEQDWVK